MGAILLLRDRSLITSRGGRWFWRGGTILKQAPFWGVNFSLVRNMRGSNFMTQQQQSREFDVSDLSSIPWLGKRNESAILKITQKALNKKR